MLHGFAADHRLNWVNPGVFDAVVATGRRAIAIDARGHGQSDKSHDPAAYADDAMVRDARAVLDHLGVESLDVVGYSMGAMVAARLVPDEPRARSVILGGVGGAVVPTAGRAGNAIPRALEEEGNGGTTNRTAAAFRAFAEQTGADLAALAAVARSSSLRFAVPFDRITIRTLVLVGEADTLISDPRELAERLPNAQLWMVPGDHLTAVGAPGFTDAIVTFLDESARTSGGGWVRGRR